MTDIQITRAVTLDANPFLYDHVIGGHAVLPMTCAVQWMVASYEQVRPGYTFAWLEQMLVCKGIVFDGTEAREYVLTIRPQVETAAEQRAAITIHSTVDGKMRMHYSAQVCLLRTPLQRPCIAVEPFPESYITGRAFYDNKTLFHGRRLQGIRKVCSVDDTHMVIEVRVSALSRSDSGQFWGGSVNPFIADMPFQAQLIIVREHYHTACLPLGCQRAERFIPVPYDTTIYVQLVITQVQQQIVDVDAVAYDAAGCVYLRITGSRAVMLDGMIPLFEQSTVR
jgi:hypothetical protein